MGMIILDKILGKKSANMNQIFISRIGHLASLLVIVSFYSSLQYRKIFFFQICQLQVREDLPPHRHPHDHLQEVRPGHGHRPQSGERIRT